MAQPVTRTIEHCPPISTGQFGVSHQQTLAQLTAQFQPQAQAQAQAQVQVQTHIQSEYTSLSSELASSLSELQHLRPNASFQHDIHPSMPDPNVAKEASLSSYSGQNSQPVNFPVDNPTDDGYIWRKYAQKYLKGSEYRRSYYRCSQPNCPIKKKVERSFEGQITKIIYEGQHNHAPPSKRTKYNLSSEGQPGNFNTANESLSYLSSNRDQEMRQVTPEQVYGSSENEEMGDAETRGNGRDEDEPESKRSSIEVPNSEQASFHRIVIEPKIIIQTPSEVDILDDGYRWRKYGQKVVKGNHYPRSYYKCSSPGCNVRKHVERDTSDPKCVLTSYEGKHNHDVSAQLRPAATTPSMQIHSSDQTT